MHLPPAHDEHVDKWSHDMQFAPWLFKVISALLVFVAQVGGEQRKPMRLEPREHRAGRAQVRQRALSAREAELGGRGPRGAVCTLSCSSVTSLQYPAAVVFSEPTIAKALIWARKVITNKICDTFLISKCHPCDKHL